MRDLMITLEQDDVEHINVAALAEALPDMMPSGYTKEYVHRPALSMSKQFAKVSYGPFFAHEL